LESFSCSFWSITDLTLPKESFCCML